MVFTPILLLLAAQFCGRVTCALSYGNATYGQTMTYGNNTYAETYLTPTAHGTSWTWSQAITPAILGTVFVVINDHNQTITSTSTNSAAVANNTQYLKNGTLSLLTRTDVNEFGTVTGIVPTALAGHTAITYPTPYFTVVDPISWEGLFPEVQNSATCCNPILNTKSAIPQNHYSFPPLTGSTNPADPRGWLYALQTHNPVVKLSGSQNLSSLFAPATIASVRQHCPYALCPEQSTVAGATAAQMAGALLETSTVRVTGSFTDSASPAATPTKQSGETSKTSAKLPEETNRVPTPATKVSTTANRAPTPVVQDSTEAPSEPLPSGPTSAQRDSEVPVKPSPAVLPTSQTSATNIGVALGQLLDTKVPTGTDTTTATKVGATAAQEASNLLTIDSNFNIIPPKSATTQRASKELDPPLVTDIPSESRTNIGDVIASLLQSAEPNPDAETQQSSVFEPPQVAVGSTSLALQATQLATTVSGVSTDIPAVIVGSQTVAMGASNSVDGIPVAVVTSGSQTAVVIDGSSTNILPQATPSQEVASPQPIVIGSSTITANSESQYIIAGQTLQPGSSITIGNTPIALQTDGPDGSVLVVGSSSSVLQQPQQQAQTAIPPPIIVGSSTITANSNSQYIVAGQTLQPGSSITIGNTPIGLQTDGPSGTLLVVGTSSSLLQQQQPKPSEKAVPIKVGGSTISANSASEYIVAGQTLKPGSSITVVGSGSSTSVIQLQTSGSETILVIGSSSSALQQQQPTTEVLTIGPAKITPLANSEYLVGSQTLTPGASGITVSGVEYSLASDGGELVAGSSTQTLTSEGDVGGYIWSALGGSSSSRSSSSGKSSASTTREASTTTPSTVSSTSASSAQTGATETLKAGAAELLVRPICLWVPVVLLFGSLI